MAEHIAILETSRAAQILRRVLELYMGDRS